ncbi:MAG TPA: MarR family transcriptional regulator [Symbiobacteriaceae bacterium]
MLLLPQGGPFWLAGAHIISHFSESRARAAGLTPHRHQMLLAIRGTPGRDWATPGEIAEALQINHNAAVGLVNRAESAGLVARSAHPVDRRRVCASLTPLGEEILEALSVDHRREPARIAPALAELLAIFPDPGE